MNTKYIAATVLALTLFNPLNAGAEGKNGVAAIVNGEKITVAEIKNIYDKTPQIHNQEKWDDFYNKAVNVWVDSKVVQQAASKSNVRKTKEYTEQMKAFGDELASKIYLRDELEKKINENDLKNLYNQYKTNFVSEKEMRARHILVDSEATANDVIAQIKKGADFNELATKYSKEKKSDLGYFTKNMMVPAFGDVAFSMKKGQYTQKPIKTEFGYHIIIVDDVRDSKPLSYTDAEPQLKGLLAQKAMQGLLADMNKNAKIQKYSLDGKDIK